MKNKQKYIEESKCIYDGGYYFYSSMKANTDNVLDILTSVVLDDQNTERNVTLLKKVNKQIGEDVELTEGQKYTYATQTIFTLVRYFQEKTTFSLEEKINALKTLRGYIRYLPEPEFDAESIKKAGQIAKAIWKENNENSEKKDLKVKKLVIPVYSIK